MRKQSSCLEPASVQSGTATRGWASLPGGGGGTFSQAVIRAASVKTSPGKPALRMLPYISSASCSLPALPSAEINVLYLQQ